MEEADKGWMMTRMLGGSVCLLVPANLGSPGQRAVNQLLWPPCVADADIIFLPCGFLWSPYGIG